MVDGAGSSARGTASHGVLQEQDSPGSLGADWKSSDGRPVVGSPHVENQEPRLLSGIQEAPGPGAQRRQWGWHGEGEGRATQEKERRRKRRQSRPGQRERSLPKPRDGLTMKGETGQSGPRVPGEGATTVHGCLFWNSLFDFVTKSRSRLSAIWFSQRARRASAKAPEGVVWPMPLPFPELRCPNGNRSQPDLERKLGVNYMVLTLNSMKFEGRRAISELPGWGTKLNKAQWGLVSKLGQQVDVWNRQPPVGPEEMGRAAAKVESVEEVLQRLSEWASSSSAKLRSYGKVAKAQGVETETMVEKEDEEAAGVVGKMQFSQMPVAKKVQPDGSSFGRHLLLIPRGFWAITTGRLSSTRWNGPRNLTLSFTLSQKSESIPRSMIS